MTDAKRKELLQLDGVGRNQLERRIVRFVELYDAAVELVAAEDESTEAPLGDRHERARSKLREVLNRL